MMKLIVANQKENSNTKLLHDYMFFFFFEPIT